MQKISRLLIIIGCVSLLVAMLLNLYGAYTLGDANEAPLFSASWWTRWFPTYLSGISMLFIGVVLRLALRGKAAG